MSCCQPLASQPVQVADLERKREWELMTPQERTIREEWQAAEWKRQWESLTPEEQAKQRQKWDEDWKRQQAKKNAKKRAGHAWEFSA
jgi:hypothetical protein